MKFCLMMSEKMRILHFIKMKYIQDIAIPIYCD